MNPMVSKYCQGTAAHTHTHTDGTHEPLSGAESPWPPFAPKLVARSTKHARLGSILGSRNTHTHTPCHKSPMLMNRSPCRDEFGRLPEQSPTPPPIEAELSRINRCCREVATLVLGELVEGLDDESRCETP